LLAGGDWPVKEFRGAWVATVANIDWPSSPHLSTWQQKQELVTLLDKLHDLNFNAIVLQVRTSGDALYMSSLEPWSSYLTGTQGKPPSPSYDPLQFAVHEAHSRNIELHAWFNPYRARAGSTSKSGLAPNHMVFRFSNFAYAYGNDIWMDPGSADVREHTLNVFMDVVSRYDIDGIHIDDYFYPYPVSGHDFPDSVSYKLYQNTGGILGLHDWRRDNINRLISKLSERIKAKKPFVKFGVSPFGIWKPGHPSGIHGFNAYDGLYADSRKWLEDGTVDYMTPQLYWQIDPSAQSYPALLDWWTQQNHHRHHLYAGNYVAGIVTKHWPNSEIDRQVIISRSRRSKYSLGNIFFSAKYFVKDSRGISDTFKSHIYNFPSLAPDMPWLNASWSLPTPSVSTLGPKISWTATPNNDVRSWAVYKNEADSWQLIKVMNSTSVSVNISISGQYAIRAVDRLGRQGTAVPVTVVSNSVNVIG